MKHTKTNTHIYSETQRRLSFVVWCYLLVASYTVSLESVQSTIKSLLQGILEQNVLHSIRKLVSQASPRSWILLEFIDLKHTIKTLIKSSEQNIELV